MYSKMKLAKIMRRIHRQAFNSKLSHLLASVWDEIELPDALMDKEEERYKALQEVFAE